jgi:hypothetical protein
MKVRQFRKVKKKTSLSVELNKMGSRESSAVVWQIVDFVLVFGALASAGGRKPAAGIPLVRTTPLNIIDSTSDAGFRACY